MAASSNTQNTPGVSANDYWTFLMKKKVKYFFFLKKQYKGCYKSSTQ